jgi:hypothetical protein
LTSDKYQTSEAQSVLVFATQHQFKFDIIS